jgi:hypothetical protein
MKSNRHNNAGPKFGIDLFGGKVRVVKSLTSFGKPDSGQDLLHIPTPWHGCIVELHGHSQLYMTKARVVRAAIDSTEFEGSWTTNADTDGALYRLRDIPSLRTTSLSVSSTSTNSFCEEKSRTAIHVDAISANEYETRPSLIRCRRSATQYMSSLYLKCRTLFGMCFDGTFDADVIHIKGDGTCLREYSWRDPPKS